VATVPDTDNSFHKTVLVLLLVDSSVAALDALRLILLHQGYSVLTAGNSNEALHIVESSSVDLIIVDHYTVEDDGLDLPAAIKQHRPRTPILMLSSMYNEDSPPSNVDVFLSKVEPPERVLDAIASLLPKAKVD
jgi:CheY-like chemotaxis protein